MQSKAEDEGILAYPKGTRQWAYVEDDNAAMRLPGRRTCLDICLVCYNYDKQKKLSWRCEKLKCLCFSFRSAIGFMWKTIRNVEK